MLAEEVLLYETRYVPSPRSETLAWQARAPAYSDGKHISTSDLTCTCIVASFDDEMRLLEHQSL